MSNNTANEAPKADEQVDDLAQFFAKKRSKDPKKLKKSAVKLEDVGAQLERKVKIQEQWDREEEEQRKQHMEDEAFFKGKENEDSEWLEYNEPAPQITEVVRDMSLNEQIEEEDEEGEERSNPSERVKTWKTDEDKGEKEETEMVPVKRTQPAKYVPPSRQHHNRSVALDLNSDSMFPSISDANKIDEKVKADEKKKAQTAWKTEEDPKKGVPQSQDVRASAGAWQTVPGRDSGDVRSSAAKDTMRAPIRREPEPAAAPAERKPGAYVPPHLRQK
jgi:hypothetical protein